MYKINKIDGYVELESTSKVSGPDQKGGLEFGTAYTYYRTSRNSNWIRSPFRSGYKLIQLAERSNSIQEFLVSLEEEENYVEHAKRLSERDFWS